MNELRQRLAALGYGLQSHAKDALGRKWRFKTYPTASGGPTNYFDTKAQVAKYAAQVEQVRSWQEEVSA